VARLQLSRSGPWIAAAGMLCLLWLCLASILLAPWWGVALMLLGWTLVGLLALGWARIHPVLCALTPLLGLAGWVALVWAGETWWGWSA
jgi:hypothetical protein